MRRMLEQSDSELTFGELRILSLIGRHPQCTPSTLVEYSRTDKAQSARTISGLHKLGLAKRRHGVEERPRHRLSPSTQGATIEQAVKAERAAIAARWRQHR